MPATTETSEVSVEGKTIEVCAGIRLTVVDTLHEESLGVIVQTLHVEALEVRIKGDLGVIIALLVVLDCRLAALAHVVCPSLLVDALAIKVALVGRFHDEFGGVDVGQFSTVAISTTCDLLLVVVIVGGGQQVAKDKFGHPDVLLAVDLHGNTATVVIDRDTSFLSVDVDLEHIHAGIVLFVVCGIDEDFVKDLVETGDKSDLAQRHAGGSFLEDPHLLGRGLGAADIGIRSFENMLQLRELGTPGQCGRVV